MTTALPQIVQFNGPRDVSLVDCERQPMSSRQVRVRTWYSGISAGTELTAFRGSNPYLTKRWDPEARLFTTGDPTFAYPVAGWGYSEVGQVVDVGSEVSGLEPGQLVYGIWGHRSDAVVAAEAVRNAVLSPEASPLDGVFARVGAIALNAVLAADVSLGDKVAIFGQGVIGLLATRLATLSGAEVVGVDLHEERLVVARRFGAVETVAAGVHGGAGAAVRAWSGGSGADSAIEISGSDRALHEAVRSVVVDGRVVASGFYQGGAANLSLGEEFHHNRVSLVASQIGGTPVALGARWDRQRLVHVFMGLVAAGRVEATSLVTDVVPAQDVAAAFETLDAGAAGTLQVVLSFDPEHCGRAAR